eukprot:TRINITY_DN73134_c0_g1_i1.p1 TRINITY_DN73134_c0_g1~~TRINITY_DN73134_c0_g1_i1.p1  ORF type:complete len:610 (-),score=83.42 TRINITY_DN73134_c0_g1_i1:65-1894(-)
MASGAIAVAARAARVAVGRAALVDGIASAGTSSSRSGGGACSGCAAVACGRLRGASASAGAAAAEGSSGLGGAFAAGDSGRSSTDDAGDADGGGNHGSDHGAFDNLSKRIHRGYKFDRMFQGQGLSPQMILEMDAIAMMSTKTQTVPYSVMDKIVRLLKDFGEKRSLERYGRYMLKKVRSRTSAEPPRVLSSLFLPEQDDDQFGPVAKLRNNPIFKDLFDHAGMSAMDDATLRRLGVANMEEKRHKLFQMFWSPEAALTYVAHRYPAVWACNFRVLQELRRRAPDFRPRRVLDYGAGPAPSLATAQDIWEGGFEAAVAIEPSEIMTQVGEYLLADTGLPPVQWRRCLYDDMTEKFDLITVSFVQMEIRGQESRDALIKQLWNRLSPGGVLVLLEQGSPTGFRFMHHTRELLISRIGADNFHFVAPCPHEGMCPVAITGRDWCHFSQRVKRTPHKVYCKGARHRDLEEVKFSFLCIRKGPGPRTRYASEKEAPTPEEKSYFWPRVLFPPIKAGQHVLIDVCSAPQNFERLSVSKSKPHHFGYRWSRKAMWGDLFRYPKRVMRPEARQYIGEQTREHLDRLAKKAWKALKWEEHEPGFRQEKEQDMRFYGR